MSRKEQPFENLLNEYQKFLANCTKESYSAATPQAEIFFEILDNWIDLTDILKIYREELPHTVSGLIYAHSWRYVGWIIYEVLTQHYFEAIRDMRFLFEGSLLSLHYEYFIDKKVFEKWSGYGKIGLKAEVIELKEDLENKRVGRMLASRKVKDKERASKLIKERLENLINRSGLSEKEKKEYFELYYEILSQSELYWNIPTIIRKFTKEWKLNKYKESLIFTWKELCEYTHFSRRFLDTIIEKPEMLWVEQFDKDLLNKCCNLCFTTMDLSYSVLVIHFPKIKEKIEEILRWWDDNMEKSFDLTKEVLKLI